jgi:hypothetical protein
MSFVKLDVVLSTTVVNLPSAAAIKKAINDAGGLHFDCGPYEVTAKKLSKLPWVERVVATHVTEVNVGSWRDGKKS